MGCPNKSITKANLRMSFSDRKKMTNLKTLQDIEMRNIGDTLVYSHLLKAEAIKWVKKEGMIITADEWNDFFNITESDLNSDRVEKEVKVK